MIRRGEVAAAARRRRCGRRRGTGDSACWRRRGQPFVLAPPQCHRLFQYQMVSLSHSFPVGGAGVPGERGLPCRVFDAGVPEWTPNVQYYSTASTCSPTTSRPRSRFPFSTPPQALVSPSSSSSPLSPGFASPTRSTSSPRPSRSPTSRAPIARQRRGWPHRGGADEATAEVRRGQGSLAVGTSEPPNVGRQAHSGSRQGSGAGRRAEATEGQPREHSAPTTRALGRAAGAGGQPSRRATSRRRAAAASAHHAVLLPFSLLRQLPARYGGKL